MELNSSMQKALNDTKEESKKFNELTKRAKDMRKDIDGIENLLRNKRKLFSNPFNEIVEAFEAQHLFGKYAKTIDEFDQQIQVYRQNRATLVTMINEFGDLTEIQNVIDEQTEQLNGAFTQLQWLHENQMQQLDQLENDRFVEKNVVNQIQWIFQIHKNNISLDNDGILANLSIAIDNNLTFAHFTAAIDAHLNQAQINYDESKQIADNLPQCIGYDCRKLRFEFKAAAAQLAKSWFELKKLQQQRIHSLYEVLEKVDECFNGKVRELAAEVKFPFAPRLDYGATAIEPSVYFLMDQYHGMRSSTIYHYFAAIILKTAMLIVTNCPIIVIDNFHSVFDRDTSAVLMEYFGKLVKFHNKQVIFIATTPQSRLDDVSSVHLMWEDSSVCRSFS